ncbi:hypothetical protein F5B20DRAFT_306961 [Whalleya microplaca]|nr:hypothetical protein F5B20DRAFT_306961 [Whalleya microplaca]
MAPPVHTTDTRLTKAQTRMLEGAIGSAFEDNDVPENIDELIQYLRKECIPEFLLVHERDIFNMFMRFSKMALHERSQVQKLSPPPPPPPPPPVDRPVTPPDSHKGDVGITVEHGSGSGTSSPREPESSEGSITLDEQSPDTFFLYVHPDSSDTDWAGFTARKCLQKQNYISQEAARRLKRASTIETKHRLVWHAKGNVGNGMDNKTRRSTFVVVLDSRLDADVALGSEWRTEEHDEPDDTSSHQPTQEQPSSIDAKVQPWLTQQDRQTVVMPGPEYPPDSTVSAIDCVYAVHANHSRVSMATLDAIKTLSINSNTAGRTEYIQDLPFPPSHRIRPSQPPHRRERGPT